MHDSKKLIEAIDAWLEERCNVGYGQVYSAMLQADFEDYCRKTGAMKASPGLTAFGREMSAKGFGRKRVSGLQYMTGLELKKPPNEIHERRRARTTKAGVKAEEKRKARQAKVKKSVSGKVKRAKQDDKVKARMALETKERNIAAGEDAAA